MDGGADYAGNVAFFSFLSLFPFLIFVTNLAATFEETQAASEVIAWGLARVPPAAAEAIRPIIDDVVSKSSGSVLTLSILGTLWVSANALEALRAGLNRAYGVRRGRSFFFHRLQGAIMVVLTGIVILIVAVVDVVLPALVQFFANDLALPDFVSPLLAFGQLVFVPVVMIGATVILYRFLPDTDHGVRNVLPGAFLAYALWLVLAAGFGYYIRNFGDYSLIYGSLGGVIVLLLFLYLAAAVFLIGAEFNVVLEEEAAETKSASADKG